MPNTSGPAASTRRQIKAFLAMFGVLALSAATFGQVSGEAAASPPQGWTDTVLPADGTDLVLDEGRGVAYVSLLAPQTVAVVDLATGVLIREIAVPGDPSGMDLGASGDVLYVGLSGTGAVEIIDLVTNDQSTISVTPELSILVWDVLELDANRLLVADGLNPLLLVDMTLNTKTLVGDGSLGVGPTLQRAGAANVLLGTLPSASILQRIDLLDPLLPVVDTASLLDHAERLKVSPDGLTAYTASQVLQTNGFAQIQTIPGAEWLVPTADGARVVAVTATGINVLTSDTFEPIYSDLPSACSSNSGGAPVERVEIESAGSTLYTLKGAQLCADDLMTDPSPLGDANCDGQITVVDVAAVIEASVGLRTTSPICPLADPTSQVSLPAADLSGDEIVTVLDATLLMNCVVGTSNALC